MHPVRYIGCHDTRTEIHFTCARRPLTTCLGVGDLSYYRTGRTCGLTAIILASVSVLVDDPLELSDGSVP